MWLKLKKSIFFWIGTLVCIYALAGFVVAPYVAKTQAISFFEKNYALGLSIEKINLNPFTFELGVKKLSLADKDSRPAMGFEELYIDYALLGLFEKVALVKSFKLSKPFVNARINPEGELNLLAMFENSSSPSATNETEKPKDNKEPFFGFLLSRFELDNGSVSFHDARGTKPFSLELGPINYVIRDLGTRKNDLSSHALNADAQDNQAFSYNGAISLDPLKIYGQIDIKNLQLSDFWDYALRDINANLLAKASLHVPYVLDLSKEVPEFSISNASANIKKIKIQQKDDKNSFVSLDEIDIKNINFAMPQQNVDIESVDIHKPFANLILDKNNQINLTQAFVFNGVEQKENLQSDSNTTQKPWAFLLKTLRIHDGGVDFTDLNPKESPKTSIASINTTVENISLDKQTPINYTINATIDKLSTLASQGTIEQEPLAIASSLELKNIQLLKAKPYIEPFVNVDLQSGNIDLKAKANIKLKEQLDANVNADLSVKEFSLADKNRAKLLSFSSLDLSNIAYAHQQKSLNIDKILLSKPTINVAIEKDKTTNFSTLIKPQSNTQEAQKKTNEKEPTQAPLNAHIKEFSLAGGAISMVDNGPQKSVHVELNPLNIGLKNISTNPKDTILYTLNTAINKKSKLALSGDFQQKPLKLKTNFNARDIYLPLAQDYLEPFINLTLAKGLLSLKGKSEVLVEDGKEPQVRVDIDSNIKDLLIQAEDKTSLLSWGSLVFDNLKYDHSKESLYIKSVTLKEPYANLHIKKDKSTNFGNIVKKNELSSGENESATQDTSAKKDMHLNLGPLSLKNGSLDFKDESLPIPFSTYIKGLNGSFSTLNTQTTKPSVLLLEGKVNKYGYSKISGSVLPFDVKNNTNINVLFKNIDMTSLTPYSGKFVGYAIKEGKLSLDLGYKIQNGSMLGDNKINLDSLTLGETIESPDAVSLPLGLAIAILKDSNGQIDIDLPVSGDLNNPDFSYGGIVWKAIGNLITGLVTSPFRFLGSMLGVSSDALKSVEFAQGDFSLVPSEEEKMEQYAKIVAKRPNLKLSISGGFDMQEDAKALKQSVLDANIEEESKRILAKDKTISDPYGEALKQLFVKTFSKERYDTILKSYQQKQKEQKQAKLDFASLHVQMQTHLLSRIVIAPDAVNQLAKKRVQTIIDTLVQKHNIPKDKLIEGEIKESSSIREKWVPCEVSISI
ncbi:MAG: DUF748 domain-containing protein [Sulfurospirillaceae bacterium]|nr:DUF748 domain-containing protein [Sulfurospirillaceae bacterium]MDD3462193.1 DUF748 domain-containing protein [Sulfurospirillaceae bacterium]